LLYGFWVSASLKQSRARGQFRAQRERALGFRAGQPGRPSEDVNSLRCMPLATCTISAEAKRRAPRSGAINRRRSFPLPESFKIAILPSEPPGI
jgi:hypothetical protein